MHKSLHRLSHSNVNVNAKPKLRLKGGSRQHGQNGYLDSSRFAELYRCSQIETPYIVLQPRDQSSAVYESQVEASFTRL